MYVGSFKNGGLDGHGLSLVKSRTAYAGAMKGIIAQSVVIQTECREVSFADWTSCIGTYRFPSGHVHRGEFAHGHPGWD